MVIVILPWRPQPSRLDAFTRVTDWYRHNLPEAELRTVDTDDETFDLARCRNVGIEQAAATDPDGVVIINDADTLPERDALLAAIEGARTSGRVHLPYDEYRWLGLTGSAQCAAGVPLDECDFELVRGACSGVYVTTPATWRTHGGQDERFRGWGFEDAAWYLAHQTLLGEAPRRESGRVYALAHETQERSGPQYDRNVELMDRYRAAASDPDAMAELVSAANAR